MIVGKEESSRVNWDDVLWFRIRIRVLWLYESEQILILSAVKENSQEVLDAKERELNSLKENNVFNCVERHGQGGVSCKWVFTEKLKKNGSNILEARLVAKGFEEKYMNERTDSSTCSRQDLRKICGNYILLISLPYFCKVTLKETFLSNLHQE